MTGNDASPAQQVGVALWILKPVAGSHDDALRLCSAAGLYHADLTVEESGTGPQDHSQWVEALCQTGDMFTFLDAAGFKLTAEQLRSVAEQLSGVLVGSPYGSQLGLRLVQLRTQLDLKPEDCVRLVSAAWPQIMYVGHWSAWCNALESVLVHEEQRLTTRTKLALLRWHIACLRWLGDFARCEEQITTALRIVESAYDKAQGADFYLELGRVQRLRGRLLSAESTARYAQSLYSIPNDTRGCNACTVELAHIALENGDVDTTLALLQPLEISPQVMALSCEAQILMGKSQDALQELTQLVNYGAGTRANTGRVYGLISKANLACSDVEAALKSIEQAVRILQLTDDRIGYARSLAFWGQLRLANGDTLPAIADLEIALRKQEALQDKLGQRATLQLLLQAYAALVEDAMSNNHLAQAHKCATSVLAYYQALTRNSKLT